MRLKILVGSEYYRCQNALFDKLHHTYTVNSCAAYSQ